MQLSYWEKNTWFSNIDIVIAGSGIVGLNAALAIKRLEPALNVLVLDRGFLPYGASTRNAGFACFGSLSELIDDCSTMSEDQMLSILMKRWKGLKRLRSILKDPNIGYEQFGGFELFTENDEASYNICCGRMHHFNKLLEKETGLKRIYIDADDKITAFGFKGVKHLLVNRYEGQIDTGMMMNALLFKARQAGVNVLNGISIKTYFEDSTGISIETDQGFSFSAKRLLITTNGFAKQLMPELEVFPARAQVLITKPIDDLKIKGTFHYEKGFYYFRNVGNRLLFGGGRNLNVPGETTWDFGLTEQIQQRLHEMLDTMILPGVKYEVEQKWSGIMGIGPSKTTIIKKITDKIHCAVRMGGMGIAIGSLIGEEAAEMVVESLASD